jgi:hypothetical protein
MLAENPHVNELGAIRRIKRTGSGSEARRHE